MRPFKFFQSNKSHTTSFYRRLLGIPMGQIRWVDVPVVIVYYIDGEDIGYNRVNMELRSMTIAMESRRINSYNHFHEMNSENTTLIFYNFVDQTSGTIYTEGNFNEMPRDVELMFRGRVLDNNLTNI